MRMIAKTIINRSLLIQAIVEWMKSNPQLVSMWLADDMSLDLIIKKDIIYKLLIDMAYKLNRRLAEAKEQKCNLEYNISANVQSDAGFVVETWTDAEVKLDEA